jgi:xanthosine utilization system XapX-like protein
MSQPSSCADCASCIFNSSLPDASRRIAALTGLVGYVGEQLLRRSRRHPAAQLCNQMGCENGCGSSFRDKLANLLAGNVEENRQRSRRSEYLPADMGIIGIRVETEVVEAIEQQVHRDPHFHASQVHSQADVCAVAP